MQMGSMARRVRFERDSPWRGLLPPSVQIAPCRDQCSPGTAELTLSSAHQEMRQQGRGGDEQEREVFGLHRGSEYLSCWICQWRPVAYENYVAVLRKLCCSEGLSCMQKGQAEKGKTSALP